jgi:hypothetical protein
MPNSDYGREVRADPELHQKRADGEIRARLVIDASQRAFPVRISMGKCSCHRKSADCRQFRSSLQPSVNYPLTTARLAFPHERCSHSPLLPASEIQSPGSAARPFPRQRALSGAAPSQGAALYCYPAETPSASCRQPSGQNAAGRSDGVGFNLLHRSVGPQFSRVSFDRP